MTHLYCLADTTTATSEYIDADVMSNCIKKSQLLIDVPRLVDVGPLV